MRSACASTPRSTALALAFAPAFAPAPAPAPAPAFGPAFGPALALAFALALAAATLAGCGGGSAQGNGTGTGTGTGTGGTLHKSRSGKASRSIEEIKLVFERNKGAIYALYNRALRDDPALQGKVVLELKIAPSGEVVDCRIAASELKADALEHKLLARIRQFDFGARDVDVMLVSWPVDFLPS